MDSIKSYAELEYQKDLISQLLKQAFIGIPKERHEEMTERVFAKIHQMNQLRSIIKQSTASVIIDTAERYGSSEDQVLDSFMYFSLIVENAFLTKQLVDYIQSEDDDGEDLGD